MQDSQSERPKMLPAALYYARMRLAVFPLAERGKRPLTEHGVKDATTDREQIEKWWTEYPTANIGIACGQASGIGVLDVDGEEGEAALASLGPVISTYESITARGRHLFFLYDARIRNSAQRLGPKLDTRSDGGYVVAPPSVHETGHVYTWKPGRSPREIDRPSHWPQWALDAFAREDDAPQPQPDPSARASNYARAALENETRDLAQSSAGGRNQQLNKAAFALGQLVGAGALDEADVFSALEGACAVNGLLKEDGRKSVRATIRSGLRAGTGKPRKLPEARRNEDAEVRRYLQQTADDAPPLSDADAPPDVQVPGAPLASWPDPLPIGRDVPPPPFPVDALPSWAADFVRAEAESVQVPVDMPAVFALGAIAALLGGRVRVRAWAGFEEGCNLFLVVAMPPASTKSPVHKHVVAPIVAYESELQLAAAPAIARALTRRDVAEKRLARLKDAAARASQPAEQMGAMADVEQAERDLEREVVPPKPRLLIDDTTPEQLKTLLAQHSGRLAMMSAESSLFGNMGARYSKAPNIEALLVSHSGDDLRVDRREREESIKDPRLTICIAVQPDVLREAHENKIARERGLFARFLYSIPPSNVGYRDLSTEPPEIDPIIRDLWWLKLRELADAMNASAPGETHVLPLSPEARAEFQTWRATLEPKLRPDGDLVSVGAWAGKLSGHVLRLAGLLHVTSPAPSGTVSVQSLRRAITLAEYFTAHAMLAFDAMGDDQHAADMRRVLGWIRARPRVSFTRGQLTDAFKGRLRAESLAELLSSLTTYGYIRRQQGPKEKRRGRPVEAYDIHPEYTKGRDSRTQVTQEIELPGLSELQKTGIISRNATDSLTNENYLGYRGRSADREEEEEEDLSISLSPSVPLSRNFDPGKSGNSDSVMSLNGCAPETLDSAIPDNPGKSNDENNPGYLGDDFSDEGPV